jgi:arginine exporter protein ArgO
VNPVPKLEEELLSGCALMALLNPSTVLAGVVLAGSWFQSLMVLGKNEFPKASLLVLS